MTRRRAASAACWWRACSRARPPSEAGIKPGDLITRSTASSIAGESSDVSTARIKGKPGTYVTAHDRSAAAATGADAARAARERIKVPVVSTRTSEARGRPTKLGVRRASPRSRPARTASSRARSEGCSAPRRAGLRARPARQRRRAARRGGAGLEPVRPERRDRHDQGPHAARSACSRRPATSITRKPVVVLVDRGTASASEIVTAALHERLGAPVVGRRTFGKGVFGQIFDLSNGGALDLIVGQLLHARRATTSTARGSRRTCGPWTIPTPGRTRRSTARSRRSPAASAAR